MVYTREFSISSFPFWSYAEDVIKTVAKHGKLDELESLIEENFADRVPTATEVNDFVWTERTWIFTQLDIDEDN